MVFRLKALDHVGFNSVVGSGGLGFFFSVFKAVLEA